jgi:CheY-like chemotaxis protein
MMMPDMDGYDALPLIKRLQNRKRVPVIAVTAQAMVGDREKCLAAGADGYISKPVDIDKLLDLLNKF